MNGPIVIQRGKASRQLLAIQIQPIFLEKIREAQGGDLKLQEFREQVKAGLRSDMQIHVDGTLHFSNRIYVSKGEVQQEVLAKDHNSAYSIYQRGMKKYQYLKLRFYLHGMKKEIAQYVSKCLVCQQVKAKH